MFSLDDIVEQLEDEGVTGIVPEIVDYDWDEENINPNGAARVTIWLKREVFPNNDY